MRKLTILDTEALLLTPPPPIDWLAEGVFARGKLCMLGGREKQGKSMLALAIAIAGVMGQDDVAGIRVKPMKVLLVDAENGEEELHRRIHAMGLEVAYAPDLVLVEARGFELRQDVTYLEDLVRREHPDLLVLDSYRSLWTGDENDTGQNAAALDPLRALAHDARVGVGLTHHSQKSGQEYRGSSAIGACIEWCTMLSRSQEDPDRYRRRLTNPLSRFARERDDRWLRLHSESDDGPVSVDAAEAYVPQRKRDDLADVVLDAIVELGPISTKALVRETDIPRSTVQRILKDAEARGAVSRGADGWGAQFTLSIGGGPLGPPSSNGHEPDSAIYDYDPEEDA